MKLQLQWQWDKLPSLPFPPPPHHTHAVHVYYACEIGKFITVIKSERQALGRNCFRKKLLQENKFFSYQFKKSTHGLSIICHESFQTQRSNFDSLYFVFHICDIFSSGNLFFNPKVTPSWHCGSSHHHLVENVLIFIMKGLKVYYSNC